MSHTLTVRYLQASSVDEASSLSQAVPPHEVVEFYHGWIASRLGTMLAVVGADIHQRLNLI